VSGFYIKMRDTSRSGIITGTTTLMEGALNAYNVTIRPSVPGAFVGGLKDLCKRVINGRNSCDSSLSS
jgi:hypothetical protein